MTPRVTSIVVYVSLSIAAATLLRTRAHAQAVVTIQAAAQPAADDAKAKPQKDDSKKEDGKKDGKAPAVNDNKGKDAGDKPAKAAEAEAKKLAARRKALAQKKPGAAAVQNAIEQQMHKQLEPMLKTELSFAARAAELNNDERRALIVAGRKWYDGFVTDFVKNQDPNQQQMLLQNGNMMWGGGMQRKVVDPRAAIRKGILEVAKSTLAKDKSQAYADESQKREDFIRKVSIDSLVMRIDEKVELSADQRKKITESLAAHFDKSNQPQLEVFAMYGNMWPGASDEAVLPALTAAQKAVFSKLNSNAGQVFFGGNLFNVQGVEIDDIDFDVPAAEDDKTNEVQGADPFAP